MRVDPDRGICQPGQKVADRGTLLLLGMGGFAHQPGGLNRYFEDLVANLSGWRGPVRTVVARRAGQTPSAGPGTIVKEERLPARLWRFARAAYESGADAKLVDAHFALYAVLPVVLGRLRHLPLVVHFHGPWADECFSAGEGRTSALLVKRWIERAVYQRAQEIVVLSGAFKRILVERYRVPPWRIHVIPPGVDLETFSPGSTLQARADLSLDPDAWVCLTVRRLVPRMGVGTLLEAWRDLLASRPGSLLLIAGDGPARGDLEALADSLGIRPSVRFLGGLTEAELVSCYRAADVCAVPSLALEGFGMVVLEALACGTPVVATEVGGLPEALAPLDPTLLVPPGDAATLAARFEGAITQAQPVPDAQACRRYAEKFSWATAAARNLDVYEQATVSPGGDRMRVVYLDHCAQLSGGELALLRLLPALDSIDAHVILGEEGPLVDRLLRAGISVEVLPMAEQARRFTRDRVSPGRVPLRTVAGTARYVAHLASRLRQLRPQLVHTNSLKSAIYGGLAGRAAGVPVTWHIRDRLAEDYLPRSAVRMVQVMASVIPSAVIANSQTTLSALRTVRPVGGRESVPCFRKRVPALVIPSPVLAVKGTSFGSNGSHDGFRIGMVGRLAPWKGQHIFLEAFARAFPERNEAEAVIVGAPLFGEMAYERELEALASRLCLAGRVRFRGFRENVAAELATFDILVHASTIPEPFGQVVVEGMAMGLLVIAAGAGGPAEVIEHGVTGLLTPPGDVAALADAMRVGARDPELRRTLGRAAREKASEFTPDAIAPRVMQVYRALIERSDL